MVELVDETDGGQQRFQLVASADGNPCWGKLSVLSPVGRGVVGLRDGEVASVETPTGTRRFRVVTVERPEARDTIEVPQRPAPPPARRRRGGRGGRSAATGDAGVG